jgi:hypothetical protein
MFRDYAILGDDIVILNAAVLREYLVILKQIGVTAGLAKSLLANGRFVLEFAKKFFVNGERADMVPLKEVISVQTSTSMLGEFGHKYRMKPTQLLAFMQYGYKARSFALQRLYYKLSRRMRVPLIWLTAPGSLYNYSAER